MRTYVTLICPSKPVSAMSLRINKRKKEVAVFVASGFQEIYEVSTQNKSSLLLRKQSQAAISDLCSPRVPEDRT